MKQLEKNKQTQQKNAAGVTADFQVEKMNKKLKTLIANQFRNTSLGFLRIKRNLDIINFSDSATEDFLRKIILSTPLPEIETKGKNYYFKCLEYNAILTINSYSFTIITAKQIKK